MKIEEKVTVLPQISQKYQKILEKLGIFTIKDLLTYFPKKYSNNTNLVSIKELKENFNPETTYLIKAVVKNISSTRIKGGRTMQIAVLEDDTESIRATWFNQPFLQDVLRQDKFFYFSGKGKLKGNKFDFYPNIYEPIIEGREPVHLNRITPEYPLTSGLTKKWFRNRMKYLIDNIGNIELKDELYENRVVKRTLQTSLRDIHFPDDSDTFFRSIKDLSLYELTNIQLKLTEKRNKKKVIKPPLIKNVEEIKRELDRFLSNLEFKLTSDQKKSIDILFKTITENKHMDILLHGDVGSGKTIVAIAASLIIVLGGYQAVVLAPTTILAKQHVNAFSKFLRDFNISISLATGEVKDVKKGNIVIGTTAVLSRKIELIQKPGLIIVDEQHKFGVRQREELIEEYKNIFNKNQKYMPHLINMSATPIPRSILQTFFGDLEVISIKEKPKNRIPIKTYLVPEQKRKDSMEWIRSEVQNGGQVYWVCPKVTESDTSEVKSAEKTYADLKNYYKDLKVGLIHGKMKDQEKIQVTSDFAEKKLDILVSTTVIEVGIDVPNATIMIIEDADRFGLAQLHQIRGRVGRGDKQSWCFLFASKNISENGLKRLEFLCKHDDGLEIAEFDLQNRGPGEIYGVQQAGIPHLKVADLSDMENIQKSRKIAETLYNKGLRSIQLFS